MDPQQGPQPDLIIGQTIGNYLVTQKLGEGGMGSVYLAEHPSIGKKVALKVLHSEFSSNQDVAARFFNEAKAVNDIGHPNIVDIVDFGMLQAGGGREQLVYFIMEYLGGTSLSHLIRSEAPLPPERALGIAIQVSDALAASHRCGIVHRDLKPDNIMLIHRGREQDFVKLLDFGIAKLTGDGAGSRRTRTGIVMGTPAYMSPEQCEGRGNVDHRTDIYALGIVLYEMLVGHVPFQGDGYGEVLVKHLTQPVIPPSQYRMLNPHVEAVVMKALEKRPDLRYPSMEEFMRAISDPIGYVEANGGIAGFSQRPLMPSNAPLPTTRYTPPPMGVPGQPTPQPMTAPMMTPVPGMGYVPTPPPGAYTVPTTLGGASGEVQGRRNTTPLLIAAVAVIAAAAIAIVFVMKGGSKDAAGSDDASGSDPGSDGSAVVQAVDAGVVIVPDAAVAVGSAGSAGSAAVGSAGSDAGSAAMPPPPKVVTFTLVTKPAGAKVLVNGVDIGTTTPTPFVLPVSKKPVTITLRLDGYNDIVLRELVPNQNISQEKTFTKKRVSVHTSHDRDRDRDKDKDKPNQGSGTKPGRGSSSTTNDTGLFRPGD